MRADAYGPGVSGSPITDIVNLPFPEQSVPDFIDFDFDHFLDREMESRNVADLSYTVHPATLIRIERCVACRGEMRWVVIALIRTLLNMGGIRRNGGGAARGMHHLSLILLKGIPLITGAF